MPQIQRGGWVVGHAGDGVGAQALGLWRSSREVGGSAGVGTGHVEMEFWVG